MLKRARIICILLLALFICSCSEGAVLENSSLKEISYHTEPQGQVYVINMNTKKYHTLSCTYAKNMKEEYKETSSDIDFIKERGYLPCSMCLKTQSEVY